MAIDSCADHDWTVADLVSMNDLGLNLKRLKQFEERWAKIVVDLADAGGLAVKDLKEVADAQRDD